MPLSPPTLRDFFGGKIGTSVINQWITAIRYSLFTAPQGALVYGDRQTNSSTTTTETGVLRVDSIPVTIGRQYVVETSPVVLSSTVNNDVVRACLRLSTSGAATTSSTQIGMAQEPVANSSFPPTKVVRAVYIPAASGTISILLSVSRQSGTGNASILGASTFPIDIWVTDLGPAPADTGIDM